MKKHKLFFFVSLLLLFQKTLSQDFQVTTPKAEFNGSQLVITYEISSKTQSDQYYVWVEMEKKNGEPVTAKSTTGDIGENVKAGKNLKIIWNPASDSIFLDEEVLVEIKAEKYIKSFNRGKVVLLSAILPGLGQTKIKEGKPWWLTGVISYGALAGGLAMRVIANGDYEGYNADKNPITRNELFNKAQKEMNISGTLIISGVAIWAANLIWVAAAPDRYEPLKNFKLSVDRAALSDERVATLLTLKMEF